ncbi:MAG: hypothetical protein HDT21_01365 [Ruminococcus sp.]|nr:hypothetical protein [Ruminococcus sp.]MBD5144562.1 hypothetical protein [Ruminococcus sp.]
MTIKKEIDFNQKLTDEQIKMLEALKSRPIAFDDDCPELTKEELAGFKRVNAEPPKASGEQTA